MGSASSAASKFSPQEVKEVLEWASSNDGPKVQETLGQVEHLLKSAMAESNDAQTYRSKTDAQINELLEALGGDEKLTELKATSMKLIADVDAKVPQDPRFLDQHLIYEGAGLDKLLKDGARIKPVFDGLCEKVCGLWSQKFGLGCAYMDAPVKNAQRAGVKVRVELNGRVTMLKDVVRGTVRLTDSPGRDTLKKIYDAFQELIHNIEEIMPGAQVVRMKDRYQRPSGKYRDFLFNIKLGTFICELQVNFDSALEHKKKIAHDKYEVDRLARGSLLDATMKGDGAAVKLFLSTGVNIEGLCDSNGCSPLAYAAFYGSYEMVVALLDHGADALARDASGWLPLQYAISQDSVDVAEQLVDHMLKMVLEGCHDDVAIAVSKTWGMALAKPAMQTVEEKTYQLLNKLRRDEFKLSCAAATADFHVCKEMIDRVVVKRGLAFKKQARTLMDPQTGKSANPLDFAILSGAPAKVTELLVEHNGCLDKVFVHGNPQERALLYASRDREASLRTLFMLEDLKVCRVDDAWDGKDNKINWGSPDWPGTPLNHVEILKTAARAQSQRVLRTMVQTGFASSQRIPELEGALFFAAGCGNAEFCELLLDVKVDVNVRNDDGLSPLHVASLFGGKAVCEILLKRGADVNTADLVGTTAAHKAGQFGHRAVVQLLSEHRANLNAKTTNGSSPADFARLCNMHLTHDLILQLRS